MKLFFVFFTFCIFINFRVSANDVMTLINNSSKIYTNEKNKTYINEPYTDFFISLNDINNELNEYVKLDCDYDFYLLLQSLWSGNVINDTNVLEEVVFHPLIKLEVVRLIAQELKKCKYESFVTTKSLRDYVLNYLDSSNPSIQSSVVWALSVVGNENDTDFLIGLIISEQQGISEYAVYALTELNSNSANEQLKNLQDNIKRVTLREYIMKSLK